MRCIECGEIATPGCRGWRAFIAEDPDEDESPFVVVYCPECWVREFGEAG